MKVEDIWQRLLDKGGVDPRYKGEWFKPVVYAASMALDDDSTDASEFKTREELLEKRQEGVMKFLKIAKEQGLLKQKIEFAPEVKRIWSKENLSVSRETITSHPDLNEIQISIIRPNTDEILPCVVYLHGGGMAVGSAFNPEYQILSCMLANQNVCVCTVDFRNCELPSPTNSDVAPFPAGLNDCFSGLKWVHENKNRLKIDSRIVLAGESGGGNLTIATTLKAIKEGRRDLVEHGIFAMCPYIAGQWPQNVKNNGQLGVSHIENSAIFLTLPQNRNAMIGYGGFIDDMLAWPSVATVDDLRQFPRTHIQVNEFDPLRDEGILFYRKLVKAGVNVSCKTLLGTIHGAELMVVADPSLTLATVQSLAAFAGVPTALRASL